MNKCAENRTSFSTCFCETYCIQIYSTYECVFVISTAHDNQNLLEKCVKEKAKVVSNGKNVKMMVNNKHKKKTSENHLICRSSDGFLAKRTIQFFFFFFPFEFEAIFLGNDSAPLFYHQCKANTAYTVAT